MNNDKGAKHVIDTVFVVALLFLFAMGALMLIALGSSIYSRSVATMKQGYSSTTAYAYITEKLRQYDIRGGIYPDEFNGSKALRIDSRTGDTDYVTYIYEYEGSLMELLARADAGSIPASQGQKIMDISSLSVEKKDENILEITVVLPDKKEITFVTAQRSARDE